MTNLIECPLKQTEQLQLLEPIIEFIQQSHHNRHSHADALKPDLQSLSSQRAALQSCHPPSLVGLTTYHSHLIHLLTKFPLDIGVKFPYYTVFQAPSSFASILPGELPSNRPISHASLPYERFCVLFNIAALYTSLAANQPRTCLEQIKQAITAFQHAAGTFSHLRNLLSPAEQDLSPDLSVPTLQALELLSLAQAQECVWQTASMEQKRNGSISKVAIEASRLYAQASASMVAARHSSGRWIGFSFPSHWIKHVNLKSAHFEAVAQYRKSCDDLASNEYGIEVGRVQHAIALLKKPLQQISNPPTPAERDAQSFMTKLLDTYQRARRDNDLIYLQVVPSPENLPEIKHISMVKSVVPPSVTEEKRLLDGILPYELSRAMGVYEERKDEWIRTRIVAKVEELDGMLVQALQAMNLPGSLQALERPITLPPSLLRNSEELRTQQASRALIGMLASVEKASARNLDTLQDITKSLDEEAKGDDRLRGEYGTRIWTRPSSQEINAELRDRERQLKQTLDIASRSDQVVKAQYREWAAAIELLVQDEESIRRAFPPPRAATLSHPNSTHSSPRKLRALLDNVEDLRKDRQRIIEATRRASAKDQIKDTDVAKLKGDLEEMFEERLAGWYGALEEQVVANQNSQEAHLAEIEAVNQDFLQSRTQDPLTKAREDKFQELDLAYHKFFEIMNTLKEGLEFHHDFCKFIAQLKEHTERFVEARNAQACEIQQVIVGGGELAKLKMGGEEVKEEESSSRSQDSRSSSDIKKKKQSITAAAARSGVEKEEAEEVSRSGRRHQPGAYDPAKHGPIRFAD